MSEGQRTLLRPRSYLTSAFRDHDGRSRHAVRRLMLLQARTPTRDNAALLQEAEDRAAEAEAENSFERGRDHDEADGDLGGDTRTGQTQDQRDRGEDESDGLGESFRRARHQLGLAPDLGHDERTDSWPNGDSVGRHYAQREAQGEHRVQHRMIDDDGDHGQHHDQSAVERAAQSLTGLGKVNTETPPGETSWAAQEQQRCGQRDCCCSGDTSRAGGSTISASRVGTSRGSSVGAASAASVPGTSV